MGNRVGKRNPPGEGGKIGEPTTQRTILLLVEIAARRQLILLLTYGLPLRIGISLHCGFDFVKKASESTGPKFVAIPKLHVPKTVFFECFGKIFEPITGVQTVRPDIGYDPEFLQHTASCKMMVKSYGPMNTKKVILFSISDAPIEQQYRSDGEMA